MFKKNNYMTTWKGNRNLNAVSFLEFSNYIHLPIQFALNYNCKNQTTWYATKKKKKIYKILGNKVTYTNFYSLIFNINILMQK